MGLGMRVRGLVVSFRFVTNEKRIEYRRQNGAKFIKIVIRKETEWGDVLSIFKNKSKKCC